LYCKPPIIRNDKKDKGLKSIFGRIKI